MSVTAFTPKQESGELSKKVFFRVKPVDIYDTIETIREQYALPVINSRITFKNGLADIEISKAETLYEADKVTYLSSKFEELAEFERATLSIDMRFNGTFYCTETEDGQIAGWEI